MLSFGDLIIDGKSFQVLGGPESQHAVQPGWAWHIISNIGIPEIMLLVGVGVVAYYAADAMGKHGVGKMAIIIAAFQSVAIIVRHLKAIFGGA